MTPIYKPFFIELPQELLNISRIFEEAGKELYLVGGAVRDALLGKTPKDYDVATNATPDEIIAIFRGSNDYLILEIGKSFGVIKLIVKATLAEYEVATFRSDVGKGRRPDSVVFTSIDQDVLRRDLTINALFYDIQKGHIVDYVGGMEDLENRMIRTVGSPEERFDEDRLRVLRAIRFAGRYQGMIHQDTHRAIMKNNSLEGVSGERIRDEFIKGLTSSQEPLYFLLLLDFYNFWPQVFPGLKVFHITTKEARSVAVWMAILLQENEPKMLAKTLNELKYSSVEVAQVSFLVTLLDLTVENSFKLKKLFKNSHLTNQEVRDFTQLQGSLSPILVEAFLRYEPTVTGDQLISEGFQGAALGQEQARRETELFRALLG